MRVLVTGASGFLGRHVVAAARSAGLTVRALLRDAPAEQSPSWLPQDVEVAFADLTASGGLDDALAGVDAVVHCAGAISGDLERMFADNVVATQNLLTAMRSAGVLRMVAVSSFSVYDYSAIHSHSGLTEESPLRAARDQADGYAHTKILQENLVREASSQWGLRVTIVRPGVIFGPNRWWTAHLGVKLADRVWVRFGSTALVPLTYVENCADAIIACLQHERTIGRTYNVVDDDLATQRRYASLLQQRMQPRPTVLGVPKVLFDSLVVAANAAHRLLRGKVKLPHILTFEGASARTKPLQYDSRRIRDDTGWSPRVPLEQALDRRSNGVVQDGPRH